MRFSTSAVILALYFQHQGVNAFAPKGGISRTSHPHYPSHNPGNERITRIKSSLNLSADSLRAVSIPDADSFSTFANQLLKEGPGLSNVNAEDVIGKLATAIHYDDTTTTSIIASLSPNHPWSFAATTIVAIVATIAVWLQRPVAFTDAPFEPGTNTYNPTASDEFYGKRKLTVVKRLLQLSLLSGAFNAGVLFDWLVRGKLLKDENYTALKEAEPRRAKEALILCENLGPTFIKLGQALSIRTDLVPAAYALELRQLQDSVTPFDSDRAYDILREELGVEDLSEVFSSLSKEPIASASIGQVYRGTLAADGKDVAVKVQRPGILSEIALDLYILRLLTPIQTKLQNAVNGITTSPEDIDTAVSLVDEWGRGFVAETDYRLEAINTVTFEAAMRKRGLDAVCAPAVVDSLVRDKVLVTEWVDGTRLDTDQSPDVPRLCGVAINAYLTMLLDTGVLHCDPHPGNLLRTTDGKLCILDWGMTLEVPNDLQYALLEFIAHINVEDYDSIPEDFINLGFSPPDVTPERLKNSGITEGLSFAFRQLSGGGGPKKIQERVKAEFQERYGNDLSDAELQKAARAEMMQRMEDQLASEGVDVKGVTNVMEEMSRRNRELFKLPPYVLYVARAFSTLEGIGLSIDENYAIVQECYPYLSRRLFTDRNPRAKKALKAMLGLADEETLSNSSSSLISSEGGAEAHSPKGLSASKLIEMSEGFTSYTAATSDVDRDGKGQAAAVAEFSKLFLDPKGSTLQDILVDETAKLADAMTRSALRSALLENPAAKATTDALRSLPIDQLSQFPERVEALVSLTPEDERVLSNARDLSNVLGQGIDTNGAAGEQRSDTDISARVRGALAGQLNDGASFVPSLPTVLTNDETRKVITEQLPGAAILGRRIGAGLLKRAAYRADQSAILPEGARKVLVDTNTALAKAVEPKIPIDD